MSKTPQISVIVTAEEFNSYLEECLGHLVKLNYPDFEILVFPTKDFTYDHPKVRVIARPDLAFKPAERRDLALEHTGGEILAFIDDDAYPPKGWLRNAVKHFEDERVAAVGGPGVTPPGDSIRARAG
ncbi:glycosyltransferase, partial [Candidatus Parcubacteria bacterium]|nr:glycosyltransferase [Candidatus Parcubacteria bacterium]